MRLVRGPRGKQTRESTEAESIREVKSMTKCSDSHPTAIILANRDAAHGERPITDGMTEIDEFCTDCWHFCSDQKEA